MARGGISKVMVQQARDALLARGERPSIDAVRVALGNTGSKSTIHRYLKELDEVEGPRLGARERLSEPLSGLVEQLAEQLQAEAQARIQAAEERHSAALAEREAEIRQLREALTQSQSEREQLHAELEERTARLADSQAAGEALHETLQALRLEQAGTLKDKEALSARIELQREHLASLEEKHRHAREALEHYREATRIQREQDERRHEQQLQQLQAELRQSAQTLMVRQDEITRLNRENARLVTVSSSWEVRAGEQAECLTELRQQLDAQQERLGRLESRLEAARETREALETSRQKLREERDAARAELQESRLIEQRLSEGLAVRERMEAQLQEQLERLIQANEEALDKDKRQSEPAPPSGEDEAVSQASD